MHAPPAGEGQIRNSYLTADAQEATGEVKEVQGTTNSDLDIGLEPERTQRYLSEGEMHV